MAAVAYVVLSYALSTSFVRALISSVPLSKGHHVSRLAGSSGSKTVKSKGLNISNNIFSSSK